MRRGGVPSTELAHRFQPVTNNVWYYFNFLCHTYARPVIAFHKSFAVFKQACILFRLNKISRCPSLWNVLTDTAQSVHALHTTPSEVFMLKALALDLPIMLFSLIKCHPREGGELKSMSRPVLSFLSFSFVALKVLWDTTELFLATDVHTEKNTLEKKRWNKSNLNKKNKKTNMNVALTLKVHCQKPGQ